MGCHIISYIVARVGPVPQSTPASSPDNSVAVIGGVTVAVVLIIAATVVTILIIIAFILRHRRAEFKPNQR